MTDLAFSLAYAIPAFAVAIGAGMVGMGAMNAAGRNPEKINDIRTLMVLGIAFIDAIAIIGFVAAILVKVL